MAKTRTFVAVAISEDIRKRTAALIEDMKASGADVRWVRPENLHYTLQFLGDVVDTEIPGICEQVAAVASEIDPFELAVGGVGAFPSLDRPRTLWAGTSSGAEEMVFLQAVIETALQDLGYRAEQRRYVPHLTLGRAGRSRDVGAIAQLLGENADFDGGTMMVEEAIIFASELGREGSKYHVLGRALLGG